MAVNIMNRGRQQMLASLWGGGRIAQSNSAFFALLAATLGMADKSQICHLSGYLLSNIKSNKKINKG